MNTTTMRRVILVATMVVSGCGGEGAAMLGADAGNGTGGAGGTSQASGGQGGAGPAGTGGVPAAGGAIGDTFTRADHDMCMAWPPCPDGVVSLYQEFLPWVRSATCTAAFDGGKIGCGECIATGDGLTCAKFVGRCVAPAVTVDYGVMLPANPTCTQKIAGFKPVGGWIVCTGFGTDNPGGQTNANVVCRD